MSDYELLPNGEINAPYILANADLLLRRGETELASKLFRAVKNHSRLGYCGHYGLGRCFLAEGKTGQAIAAFEKALSLVKRPYIATILLKTLIDSRNADLAERRALELARD